MQIMKTERSQMTLLNFTVFFHLSLAVGIVNRKALKAAISPVFVSRRFPFLPVWAAFPISLSFLPLAFSFLQGLNIVNLTCYFDETHLGVKRRADLILLQRLDSCVKHPYFLEI